MAADQLASPESRWSESSQFSQDQLTVAKIAIFRRRTFERIEGTNEWKKVDIWANCKTTLFSRLPVYLWIDVPSVSQDKDCSVYSWVNIFKNLKAVTLLLQQPGFALYDFRGPYSFVFLALYLMWCHSVSCSSSSFFLRNNSRAFSVCSYSGFAWWFGFGA